MRPLATLNYTKNNIIKTLPIFISMIFGVFLIYFISLIGQDSHNTMKITRSNFYSSYTRVYSNNENPLPENIITMVKGSNNIEKVTPMLQVPGDLVYNSVFGSMSFSTLNLFEADMLNVLDKLKIKLIEGKLPEQDKKEILIPLRYAKQKKLKIGHYIGSEVSSEYNLQGKYLISGIIDGPLLVSVISDNRNNLTPDKAMTYSFMFSLKDKDDTGIIKNLNAGELTNTVILDSISNKETVDQILQVLSVFTVALDLVTILILCISLGNLNYINFLNRKYEFGVLSAIGYKKSKLYFKLWKENSLVCLTGYAGGLILATLVCFLINLTIWEVDGRHVPLWSSSGIIYAFAVPLFVSLFGLLPPIRELKKTDPIEVLGRSI